jgi:hypothetical protein
MTLRRAAHHDVETLVHRADMCEPTSVCLGQFMLARLILMLNQCHWSKFSSKTAHSLLSEAVN